MTLYLKLRGAPRTKKNSSRIVRAGERAMLIPSSQYVIYEKDCMRQIPNCARMDIDYPVNVCCTYYMPTRRKVDLSNLEAATHDILVKAGVLADDNRDIIAGTDGSRVFYDAKDPRVDIEITEMLDYEQWKK